MENKNIRILYAIPSPSSTGGMRMLSQMFYDYGLFKQPSTFHFDTYYSWGESKAVRAIQSVFLKMQFVYVLLSKKIDVVYIMTSSNWGFYDKVFYCLLARICNVKSVLNPVGGHFIIFHQRNKFNKIVVPICLKIPNAVISGTSYWYSYFKENFQIKVLANIPNPVNFKNEVQVKKMITQKIVVTFLSRIEFDKGIDTFVNVVLELEKRLPDIKFIIGGKGSKLDWVKEKLNRQIASGIVDVRGFVGEDEKDSIFKQTDVYLLPTDFEVLPISILEAMSYGNIVLSTNVGGIPDAILNNETGFLIDRNNIEQIVSCISTLKEDLELRQRISESAFLKCRSIYSMDIIVSEHMDLFRKLI